MNMPMHFACCAGTVAAFVLASSALGQGDQRTNESDNQLWVYFGTYTGPKSKGIYLSSMDLTTGKLTSPELAGEVTSPSFVAFHPNGRFLYAVNEVAQFGGKRSGAVSAFGINASTGKLTLLNQQPSGGDGPCHLS